MVVVLTWFNMRILTEFIPTNQSNGIRGGLQGHVELSLQSLAIFSIDDGWAPHQTGIEPRRGRSYSKTIMCVDYFAQPRQFTSIIRKCIGVDRRPGGSIAIHEVRDA